MLNRTVLIKPIQNSDGYYVSNDGKIYSCWVNKGVHGLVKEETLKELRCSRSKSGHLTVKLNGRKGKTSLVHRIVYETFIGPIAEGLVIRHLNDDPADNRIENLGIGTQKENIEDARRNGVLLKGEQLKISKLTNKDVKYIMENEGKMTQREMGEKLGVNRKTVSCVLNGLTWNHVTGKERKYV